MVINIIKPICKSMRLYLPGVYTFRNKQSSFPISSPPNSEGFCGHLLPKFRVSNVFCHAFFGTGACTTKQKEIDIVKIVYTGSKYCSF